MRRDMKDIIIDVYRRGSGYSINRRSRARLKRANPDDLPKFLSNRHVRDSYPNDRLVPLEKFLESNAGRPWNDVYSEIREHCDTRNIRGQHLWEHVISSVLRRHPWEIFWNAYVDDDGILRYAPKVKYPRPLPPITRIDIDENTWYEYIDFVNEDGKKYRVQPRAQWYLMRRTFETYKVWKDIWNGGVKIDRVLVPQTREIIIKRQVSKRQLKRIKQKIQDIKTAEWKSRQSP